MSVTTAAVSDRDLSTPSLADVLDLERYPLHDLEGARMTEVIEACRAQLREDGCIVLEGFVKEAAREAIRSESLALTPHAAFTESRVNAYFTEDDPSLPEGDPRRMFMSRTSGFVPRDCFDEGSLIRAIYESPLTQRFLARCFEVPALYDYADPLAGLTLNVVPSGAEFPWHYDTNHFAVTLMTQPSEHGGEFQYAPNIRTPDDECFESVADVIEGNGGQRVTTLELAPGDLQLFRGRYSLHRVAPVTGPSDRLLAVFAYCEEPGMIGRMERTRQLFGRVTQAHVDAQANLSRNDTLVD
ncbi:hypothetical protein [Halomonas smyrnensis]|uniref:HalD/BesD family halogenase n=1 Tax=Halomonas smyrnensis TaxID=720605 RepID=UPI0002F4B4A8|nr:hypothetical protein [Halomonas smyrnensis]